MYLDDFHPDIGDILLREPLPGAGLKHLAVGELSDPNQ